MANISSPRLYLSQSRYIAGLMGMFALLLLGGVCLGALANFGLSQALFVDMWHDPYISHVLVITIKQALLSTFFAALIGSLGAIAFHRRGKFRFRSGLLLACFSAMIMPTSVAALGLLKLWGQSGLIAHTPLGDLIPDRLGLWSVILAHIFFNAPLVMRVCLTALDNMPLAQKRQAALLCLSPWRYFIIMDWPILRSVLPSVMGLVFLLCFTSFSLVLMLGGGPAVTTLEVSIYTSLRFDFDLPKAAFLSFVQLLICAILLRLFGQGKSSPTALHRPQYDRLQDDGVRRGDAHFWLIRLTDGLIICTIIILTILPLLLLLVQSDVLAGLSLLGEMRLWRAFYHSLSLAFGASILALSLAFLLGFLAHECRLRGRRSLLSLIEVSHSLFLLIPALVLGTALFILLRQLIDVTAYGFWILLLGNGLLALPFCYRIITPALLQHLAETDPLCEMLHLSGWQRFHSIIIPSLRQEIGFALGLSAALSFGDLGIITLFGSQNFETLPYMLFHYLNRYGADEADFLALLLLVTAVGLYVFFTKMVALWGRRIAR